VAGFAIAGWLPANEIFRDPLAAALEDHRPLPTAIDALLLEASVACARIRTAERFADRLEMPEALFGRTDHPFLTFIRCTLLRARMFAGDFTRAQEHATAAINEAPSPLLHTLANAFAAMVSGDAHLLTATRQAAARLAESKVPPNHLLASGVYVAAAFAAMVQNDIHDAGRLILKSATDPDLSNIRIADQAAGFEMLARAAIDEGDLDLARAWQSRANKFAGLATVSPTVDRLASRIAHAEGNFSKALSLAERSIQQADLYGRGIDVLHGEVLAARVRDALNPGTEADNTTEVSADDSPAVVPQQGAPELPAAARRFPASRADENPKPLSSRERRVATFFADGMSCAEIADMLYPSEEIARNDITRILHRLGAPTRSSIPPLLAAAAADALPPILLSEQLHKLAEMVSNGASNREIADELGIGVFTVEKQLSAILDRWELSSREDIGSVLHEM
jgi:DNA-binding NarL/FixJ family response regulator